MDLAPVLDGFGVVLEPTNLLYCLIGVVIGMLVGVLPGLGPAATIAILLPITYGIEPVTAIIMLAGIFYGAQYGGTITSVLLRLPGEASSVVTVFDGFSLARQGRAGTALGIAAVGSFIGGTVSIVALSFVAPLVAGFALDFGPPEYTALALLGILLVATFVAVAAIGPLLSGYDPNAPSLGDRLQGPSADHLLGTDDTGRDHRDPAAGDVRNRAGHRDHHAGGHLLRRSVRRHDHLGAAAASR